MIIMMNGCRGTGHIRNFCNEVPPDLITGNDTKIDWGYEHILEKKKTFLHISPNPTSSSITIYFAYKWKDGTCSCVKPNCPSKWTWFPQDFSIELYHIDKLVHEQTFYDSYGTEVLSEEYLQKDGTYTLVAKVDPKWKGPSFYKEPFTTNFLVQKR